MGDMSVDDLGPRHQTPEAPRAREAQRREVLLQEAARNLAETTALYGVLTRADLAKFSGVNRWPSVDFDAALECAIALGLVRRLAEGLYESLGPPGPERTSSSI